MLCGACLLIIYVFAYRKYGPYSFAICCNEIIRYQSTLLGSFQTVELIETFMNYQVKVFSIPLVAFCFYATHAYHCNSFFF